MQWLMTYNINNNLRIKDIQNASMDQTSKFGFKIEHGLVCSEEWWDAVEQGLIEKHIVDGVITRLYRTGHNDYPEFEIKSQEGTSSWPRCGNDEHYKIGAKVRVVFVWQKFKKPLEGGELTKFLLSIEVQV